MGCKVNSLQRLFVVLLFLSLTIFAWSLLASTIPENKVLKGDSPARRLISERVKHLELMTREKKNTGFGEELDLNYVSRRRIPTGPDPVHNRRFVRLRVPPARH